ncbi:hypothetical protein BD769DRAFT_1432344 [Suillus cothurnatus]|nr:hypothetical protein BD769DRAFT_1432344 [Suillus cothurnatus]
MAMKSSLTVHLNLNIAVLASYLAFMADVIWGCTMTCDVPYRARRFNGCRDGDSASQVKLDFFIYVVNSSTCYHCHTNYERDSVIPGGK